MQQVHIRLPAELVKVVDHLAVDRDCNRGQMMRSLLEVALYDPDTGALRTERHTPAAP